MSSALLLWYSAAQKINSDGSSTSRAVGAYKILVTLGAGGMVEVLIYRGRGGFRGQVQVLDFGLAGLAPERDPMKSEAETEGLVAEPGVPER